MSEWLKEHAWKACVGETLPRVRIPLSPPINLFQTLDLSVRSPVRLQNVSKILADSGGFGQRRSVVLIQNQGPAKMTPSRKPAGALHFHPTRRLTSLDVDEVLATVEPRIKRLLDRRGLGDGDNDGSASDAWADEAPVLAGLAAASVQGIVALGPQRGARLRRLGDAREEREPSEQRGCHARANGFDRRGRVTMAC